MREQCRAAALPVASTPRRPVRAHRGSPDGDLQRPREMSRFIPFALHARFHRTKRLLAPGKHLSMRPTGVPPGPLFALEPGLQEGRPLLRKVGAIPLPTSTVAGVPWPRRAYNDAPRGGNDRVVRRRAEGGKWQVPQEGIEPPTLALGVPCSVLLSYWGVIRLYPERHKRPPGRLGSRTAMSPAGLRPA